MSASNTPNTGTSSSLPSGRTPGTTGTTSKSTDWVGMSLLTAKTITAAAECAPFPYIKGVFGIVVILLETVEKVKRNREDLKDLCDDAMEIIKIVRDQISAHGDTAALQFKGLCEDLERCLQEVMNAIKPLQKGTKGWRSRVKEIIKLSSTTEQITGFQNRIQTLRSNFVLLATIDTNFEVKKMTMAPNVPVPLPVQNINNCPPPSRLFQGRQAILNKMHGYFNQDTGNQHIFLLHGLGGAGKTQIAFKFIKQASTQFSDIFLIDTSTQDTVDTGLKNIAVTKNAGTSQQDALRWLSNTPAQWLLFFDNADDPKINLNQHFPKCSHGNILITSRNPGLCVYAGAHSSVSDMEESDAIVLLLTSAVQEITSKNKEIGAEIVKALWYLPLAIIQAGAFIAKSGALNTYLALYTQNKARLLSEKPTQSHDDYAWTVSTNELRAYSLINFNGEQQVVLDFISEYGEVYYYSHKWEAAEGFLAEVVENRKRRFGDSHVATLAAMSSLAETYRNMGRLEEAEKLGVLVVEKRNKILGKDHPDTLRTMGNLALTYGQMGRLEEAEKLGVLVVEKRKNILGKDHPDTLLTMSNLALTYRKMGRLEEAEKLGVLVVEKQSKILGEDHPDTLRAMGSLASTYNQMGRLEEAEELEVLVVEKQRKILGEDHPDTLLNMGNLASTYHQMGRLEEAETLHILVLEKRTRLLGEDHPHTLWSMSSLEKTYRALGKVEEAESLKLLVEKDETRKI
ncbi:hypothetical protein B0H11DRAFT_2204613 [Mycena galericulata]|nr:hypothetical protein B0H11DRAFT_2204613 [Mycena galericulata]